MSFVVPRKKLLSLEWGLKKLYSIDPTPKRRLGQCDVVLKLFPSWSSVKTVSKLEVQLESDED